MMNLQSYVEENINVGDEFYSESFSNLVFDYLESYEEFTSDDIDYLEKNGYYLEDFMEYDEESEEWSIK